MPIAKSPAMSPLSSVPPGPTFTRLFPAVQGVTGPFASTQRSCTKTSRLSLVSAPGASRSSALLVS